jgi:ribosomal protein S12 methylthiotransferase accessory factor
MEDLSYLLPDDERPRRRRADFPEPPRGDLREDVLACVERAAGLGLEVVVLDQTRPDIGLHVAKVVVPGLRHLWPRLGPGRLYEVPVSMGWLPSARAEGELNPVHLFL